jgi:uncharacterized protein YndB with AHSA1/START domain
MSNDQKLENRPTRAYEMTLDIDAPQDAVWDAWTKAEELVRWFPMEAEVSPGEGGSMRWAWGEAWSGVMRIDVWEPPRVLRLVDRSARPYDANGQPIADGSVAPAEVAVTVSLETVDGRTRVHLVHSGFGSGAAWDDEIDGVGTGWQVELRSLRHYLTRHRGRTRFVAHAHRSTPVSTAEAWSALVNPAVAAVSGALEEGQGYSAVLATGDEFNGDVQLYIPGRELCGTARELDDGVFRLSAYPAGGRSGLTAWAATYDPAWAETMRPLGRRLQKLLDGLFAVA